MQKNNIDFQNIQKYFDIVKIGSEKYICDKNRDIQAHPDTYKIVVIDLPYCDWWKITANRSKVLQYFRDKYKN